MYRDYPVTGRHHVIPMPLSTYHGLQILHDQDFYVGPTPSSELISPEDDNSCKPIACGVSCDLLLSSLCLWETKKKMMSSIKKVLLEKWLALSDSSDIQAIMPILYRSHYFSSCFRTNLHEQIAKIAIDVGLPTTMPHSCDWSSAQGSYSRVMAESSQSLRSFVLVPLKPEQYGLSPEEPPTLTSVGDYPGVEDFRPSSIRHSRTEFSTNSTCHFIMIKTKRDCVWRLSYAKLAKSFPAELQMLPLVTRFFRPETLQKVIAVDYASAQVYYESLNKPTLSSLRLRYHLQREGLNLEPLAFEGWLLGVELLRAKDVLGAYKESLKLADSNTTCDRQSIHRFYYERLHGNRRLKEFYAGHTSDLLPDGISLDAILDLPLVINGKEFQTLRHYLQRAEHVLNPKRRSGLKSLPITFGLGDGHGGNVMISDSQKPSTITYIDYEVAGYHTPFLDLAKPLYLDGFMEIAYADLMHEDLDSNSLAGNSVQWRVQADSVRIDYTFDMQPISKALASIKLEYMLRPVFDILLQFEPSKLAVAEETLACALFSCALLSRNYSKCPNVFFLNLALGIELATDTKQTFMDMVGWNNWPRHKIANDEGVHYERDMIPESQNT